MLTHGELTIALGEANKEIERLRKACAEQDAEVCQALGKALDYPWYKDDQKNFPGSTEADGVCVGEHVAETLAMEAAASVERLRNSHKKLLASFKGLMSSWQRGLAAELEDVEAVVAAVKEAEEIHVA